MDSEDFLSVISPKNLNLEFQPRIGNIQGYVWSATIKIQNSSQICLAYKLLTNCQNSIRCKPSIGLLNLNEIVTIHITSSEAITGLSVKIISTRIDKPYEYRGTHELLDYFRKPEIKVKQIVFSSSEMEEPMMFSCIQLDSLKSLNHKSLRISLKRQILDLQKEQEDLINQTRELNKKIVALKTESGIPLEEVKRSIVFTLPQLIFLIILTLLLGFSISER